jgi:hypothetical protein
MEFEKFGIFILCMTIGIYYDHLMHFWPFGDSVSIWYIFPHFGISCQEKSGNPVLLSFQSTVSKVSATRVGEISQLKFSCSITK